jgi:hypothetical protein
MNSIMVLVLLCIFTTTAAGGHPKDRACIDFNVADHAGIDNFFVCPSDGVAGVACQESYLAKPQGASSRVPANVQLNETVIYVLLGPKSKVDAFRWWLPLITQPVDIVLVMDACVENGVKRGNSSLELIHKHGLTQGNGLSTFLECDNFVHKLIEELPKKVKKVVNFYAAHVHPEDETYQKLSCKVGTAMKEIYRAFPEKRYYLKIDTDTIIFPGRLLHFLSSLESVHAGGVPDGTSPTQSSHPIYFGTVVESGMNLLLCANHREWKHYGNVEKGGLCYAQGGAGYGLNNKAMAAIACSPSCSDPARVTQDEFLANEDAWTGMSMQRLFNLSVIHCGAFSSSELAPDHKLRSSISFHYIDANWLRSYGETALKHYYAKYRHTEEGGR